jgi:cell division protein FtsQ
MSTVIGSTRIAQRRRAVRRERRRMRRRIVGGVLLLGAIVYGGVALTHSSVFRLERIEVVGARSVATDVVIAASGLRTGEQALALDLDAAAASVAALPQISDAHVERIGSLGVRIVVRERVAVVELRDGDASTYLDATGEPVEVAHRPSHLPVMRAVNVMPDQTGIASALQAWRALPRDVRARVTELTLAPEGLRIQIDSTTAIIGTPDRVGKKVEAFLSVERRARAAGDRLLSVDVRTPERPTARVA